MPPPLLLQLLQMLLLMLMSIYLLRRLTDFFSIITVCHASSQYLNFTSHFLELFSVNLVTKLSLLRSAARFLEHCKRCGLCFCILSFFHRVRLFLLNFAESVEVDIVELGSLSSRYLLWGLFAPEMKIPPPRRRRQENLFNLKNRLQASECNRTVRSDSCLQISLVF